MTPITWLSCFVTLWIIVVDTQAGTVDPLVLAVYSQKYDEERITFADLTNATDKNLKLPLDAAEPKYFVLFCGKAADKFIQNTHLIAQRITAEIDSEARKIKCDHLPLPCIAHCGTYYKSTSILAFTGYYISTAESFEQSSFNKDYKEILEFNLRFYKYLHKIRYNYIYRVPQYISHKITAHMHSNTYEKECKQIRFDTFTVNSEVYNLNKLHDIKVDNYKWRQLVPMQDFMDIYATEATCTYLNYVLLHEKVIESLKKIENFIRDVANVINVVRVESGTYTPQEKVSILRNESNQTIIPAIVWKKITHRGSSTNYYSVVIVIHNIETERICDHKEQMKNLGLPEYGNGKKEIGIGDMYYCLTDNEIINMLDYDRNEAEKPLNLNNLPFEEGEKKNTIDVISKIKENKTVVS